MKQRGQTRQLLRMVKKQKQRFYGRIKKAESQKMPQFRAVLKGHAMYMTPGDDNNGENDKNDWVW